MKSPETSNQLNSEPSYKNDHTYIYMISLLEDRKNLESIRSTLVIAREQPEAFGDLFLSKLDIFEQVLDGLVEEAELGKRNYPPTLLEFAKSLTEEFAAVAFK